MCCRFAVEERDGYQAVQLGFEDKPRRLASRSERGHVAKLESKRSKKRAESGVELVPKADCEPQRFIREFRGPTDLEVGAAVTVEQFAEVKRVDVTGTSKGRGFSGVMKRHNFSGQRAIARCQESASSRWGYGLQCIAQSSVQGDSHVGAVRQYEDDIAEPRAGSRRHRKQFVARSWRGSRPEWWICHYPRNEQGGLRIMATLTVYDETGGEVGKYEIDTSRSPIASTSNCCTTRW